MGEVAGEVEKAIAAFAVEGLVATAAFASSKVESQANQQSRCLKSQQLDSPTSAAENPLDHVAAPPPVLLSRWSPPAAPPPPLSREPAPPSAAQQPCALHYRAPHPRKFGCRKRWSPQFIGCPLLDSRIFLISRQHKQTLPNNKKKEIF